MYEVWLICYLGVKELENPPYTKSENTQDRQTDMTGEWKLHDWKMTEWNADDEMNDSCHYNDNYFKHKYNNSKNTCTHIKRVLMFNTNAKVCSSFIQCVQINEFIT